MAAIRALLAATLLALAASPAAASERQSAQICGTRVEFPGEIRHFRMEEADPFGARADLAGALHQDSESVLLRFNCWRLAAPRRGFPDESPALEAMFRFTRGLGIFGQSYVYRLDKDRMFLRVSGERTMRDRLYEVRFEFHLFADRTIGVITSYRKDSREARNAAEAFVDSLRLSR
jgi:hypothetical protein